MITNSSLFILLIVTYCNILQTKSNSLRVYGGRDALMGEFPYVVRIEVMKRGYPKAKFDQRCTGAALTSTWILAAAHCHSERDDYFKNPRQKLIARYNSHFPKYKGKISPISEVKIHPTFSHVLEADMKSDICLFRSKGILVSSFGKLSPVEYSSLVGHEASALGFGLTNSSEYQKPLQVLKGMLYECKDASLEVEPLLCLMPQCGVQTTICGGDSGGPVVHSSGIVGVNSMSKGDCHESSTDLNVARGTHAAILALVSPNIDWMANIISNRSQH